MRGREFLMKDAYSFDEDQEAAHKSYYLFRDAYNRIFDQLGLDYRIVKADAGAIGGSLTEEFQVLAEVGEDELLVSDGSDYAANIEICPRLMKVEAASEVSTEANLEEISTPNLKTIEDLSQFLNMPHEQLVKTMFFEGVYPNGKTVKFTVLLRGSDQVNAIKIKNHLGFSEEPRLLDDSEVLALTGAHPGSCGPVGVEGNVYMDQFLSAYKNMVVGANKDNFHLKGVCPERDFKVKEVFDLSLAQAGDPSPDENGKLQSIRGIEVGHIFYLGTKYSKSMKAQFLDAQGKAKPFEMGCYGLGVTRTLQAAIEQSHDENGIVWPKSLAPFDVHLCVLDSDDEMDSYLNKLISKLEEKGFSVFVDDRKERPGVKFKDADLMGFPVRVTLGGKGFKAGELDVVNRKTMEKIKAGLDDVSGLVEETYAKI
jgi:prolyl-tRNA synthetase